MSDPEIEPVGSIVIPAYNEGENITKLLESIVPEDTRLQLEIAVVCNGCTDNTHELALRFTDRVTVQNLVQPSKTAALNRGDAVVASFPRIYLDADVKTNKSVLLDYLEQMRSSGLPSGGININFELDGRPYLVKCFYAIWSSLPYQSARTRSMGSGFYALSEAGRSRFSKFPDVVADDEFINRLFSPDQRFQPPDLSVVVRAPKTLLGLIRIKSRSYAGNRQLERLGIVGTGERLGTKKELLGLLRSKETCTPTLVYIAIQTLARAHSRIFRATARGIWLRDESNRTGEAH